MKHEHRILKKQLISGKISPQEFKERIDAIKEDTYDQVGRAIKLLQKRSEVHKEGKINDETLKAQLNKVLEALPELKPQANQQTGFQIGASGSNQQQGNQNDQLASIFGNKK